MKKIEVIILLLVSAMGFAQNPIVNTFDDYTRLLSPEELYLQTDREVYNVGDTVWLKGYLRNLYAIIDVYSRYIVAWGLYNTLDASNAIEVLERAVAQYGSPEIINSDQGVQYTCEEWHKTCGKYGIRISMDGRARCLDNVWIERFWRTIKREYVYLNPEPTVRALRNGIRRYIDYYNNRRCHQGLGHQVPGMLYAAA